MPVPSATHHWSFDSATIIQGSYNNSVNAYEKWFQDLIGTTNLENPYNYASSESTGGYLGDWVSLKLFNSYLVANSTLTYDDKTFSFGGWVKWNGDNKDGTILAWAGGTFRGATVGILPSGQVFASIKQENAENNTSDIKGYVRNGTDARCKTQTIYEDVWYHIAATFDSTGSGTVVKIYLNGVLEDSVTSVQAMIPPADQGAGTHLHERILFGRMISSPIADLDGGLDDTKIWREIVLSDAEVLELYESYTGGSGAPTDPSTQYDLFTTSLEPVARWRLDEASGTTITDSIGSLDGTYSGTPTLGQTSLITTDTVGTSVSGFATANYGSVSESSILNIETTGKLGVSLWFKTGADITTRQGLVGQDQTSRNGWQVYVSDSKICAIVYNPDDSVVRLEQADILANSTYHLVANFSGTTGSDEIGLYVNGVKSNVVSTNYPTGLSEEYYSFTGTLDDIIIYSKELTSAEVIETYLKGSDAVGQAILALSPTSYWKMDDGAAEAVTDATANNFDGYWVSVDSNEATQDDVLGDGVFGMCAKAAQGHTGYMENTAIFPTINADTGDYTWIGWAIGNGGNGYDVMSFATTAVSGTAEYRGRLEVLSSGELSWTRIYQTGVNPISDIATQTSITTGLGLNPDSPYLFAVRENSTTTEILVNGSVVISESRVGNAANDTTHAPREELRVGNYEEVFSGGTTSASFVHSAIFGSALSNGDIQSVYNAWVRASEDGTITSVQTQGEQTVFMVAESTGTLNQDATIVSYQEDRILENSEFISQSAGMAATYTSPDNYVVSNQAPQGASITSVVTGDPTTYRFSTHGITTDSSSTPANTPIAPKLLNPGNYKNEIDIKDVGVVVPSFGQVVLDNSDGSLDGLMDKAFDGGSYKLYYGPKGGTFPDDFTKVVDTVMGKPTFDHKTIKVQLKDKMDFLDRPLINDTFTGTGGVNGESTVQGKPKQRIIGRVWGAPTQLIDPSKLIYWVCSEEMFVYDQTSGANLYLPPVVNPNYYRQTPKDYDEAQDQTYVFYGRVFDGGTQITNGLDYVTEADVFASQPAAGEVRWYRPKGVSGVVMFRLGSAPAADVKVDLSTTIYNSPYGRDTWTINNLLEEIPEVSVSSSSTNVGITRGFFVQDSSFTYKDALKEFMKKDFYFARFERSGDLKVSQVKVPSSSDVVSYTFTESNMSGLSIEQRIPAWKININSGEALGGQVNSGIPQDRKDEFTETPYHTLSSYENPATKSRHKLSEIIDVTTKSWWNQNDIDSHTELARSFLMEDRLKLTITLDRGHMNSETLLLDVGDVVQVKMPRYNHDLGKNYVIHGVRHDYGTGKLTFTLWG